MSRHESYSWADLDKALNDEEQRYHKELDDKLGESDNIIDKAIILIEASVDETN